MTAANINHCDDCDALLTSADDEAGCCTQCERPLPRLRRLLLKVAAASTHDPGESDLDDEQPVRTVTLDLGDVRLARRLLAG